MTAQASLFTDQKIVRCTYSCQIQAFQDNLRAYFLIILQLIQALAPWLDDHPSKDLKLCTSALAFCVPIHNVSTHFWARPSMSRNHATAFAWRFSHPSDSNISLYSFLLILFTLHSRWVHPKYTWSRNDAGSPRSTSFIKFFHIGAIFRFLPAILMSST